MRRKGGGAKALSASRFQKEAKADVFGTVQCIEYDPNRSAFIALIKYDDGELSYILAPQRLNVGDKIVSSDKADIKPVNSMPFTGLPIGTIIHNIERCSRKGAQLARSAGVYAQFVGRDRGYAQIKLSSGELRINSSRVPSNGGSCI